LPFLPILLIQHVSRRLLSRSGLTRYVLHLSLDLNSWSDTAPLPISDEIVRSHSAGGDAEAFWMANRCKMVLSSGICVRFLMLPEDHFRDFHSLHVCMDFLLVYIEITSTISIRVSTLFPVSIQQIDVPCPLMLESNYDLCNTTADLTTMCQPLADAPPIQR